MFASIYKRVHARHADIAHIFKVVSLHNLMSSLIFEAVSSLENHVILYVKKRVYLNQGDNLRPLHKIVSVSRVLLSLEKGLPKRKVIFGICVPSQVTRPLLSMASFSKSRKRE